MQYDRVYHPASSAATSHHSNITPTALPQMVEAGEGGLAEEYRKRFGLPPALMAALIDPEALAAQEAARAAK